MFWQEKMRTTLMAAPILLPIITTAGFDPIWFAVVLTINMEIGLISPPVIEHLCYKRHCPRYPAQDHTLGLTSICSLYGCCNHPSLHLPRYRNMAPRRYDGISKMKNLNDFNLTLLLTLFKKLLSIYQI